MEAPHLLTAGWDGLIGVWDLTPGVNEEEALESNGERSKKKRRKSQVSSNIKNKVSLHSFLLEGGPGLMSLHEQTPMSVLRGHSNKVSRAIFDRNGDSHLAYSASWDHSVRVWDLAHGIERENKVSISSLSPSPSSSLTKPLHSLSDV